jgi:hypothetical protein
MAELFDLLTDEGGSGADILDTLNASAFPTQKFNTDADKKNKHRKFDQPIPGQSLTGELGNAKYEQPPQYTELREFIDYMFKSISRPKIYRNLMRMLDAGVPVRLITGPVLMQAVSEGKISMDLAMLSAHPLATIIGGMGEVAGINVIRDGRPEDHGLDPRPIQKAFKNKRKEAEPPKLDVLEDSLVSRRAPNES